MLKQIVDVVNRLTQPLHARVRNMLTRAVVKLVNDDGKMQLVQIKGLDVTRDDVERFQNYGFSSVPKDGAEAVVLHLGANGDHPVVIVVEDRRYRLKGLDEGEVALYDDKGSTIVLKASGNVEITANADAKVSAGGDVSIDGGTIAFKGGSTPVAKEGSATTGHMHTLSGTAGPYSIAGTAVLTTDSVATGAGSANVQVP